MIELEGWVARDEDGGLYLYKDSHLGGANNGMKTPCQLQVL